MTRMLIIDDNPGDLRLMVEMLTESLPDLDIVPARGGAEALDWLRNNAPDIILVDHNMPGMHGTAFIDAAQDAGVEAPLVLFTGSDDPALAASARSKGAARVLVKPASLQGFQEAAVAISAVLAVPA